MRRCKGRMNLHGDRRAERERERERDSWRELEIPEDGRPRKST